MADIKSSNDLMYAIAKRVKELADKPVSQLREMAFGYGCDTAAEAKRLAGNAKRGECLEIIITEEFDCEIDRQFEE